MGITGLLPFIEDASRKCYINEFRGYTVAIDSYCWLHKGAFAVAEKLVRGEQTKIHINYCLKYIQLLLDYNIKPILVFDGQHLPAKKDTELKRREQRKAARTRATELLRLGKTEEARQNFRKCVDITHDMALDLMKECRKRDIDCIVAPYEADAQLAYLNTQGIAQIVITEDSDLVLFGCSKILFKFSLDGSATLVERDKLYLAMKMRPDEYTFDKFRYMCIMSGCDYLDSLPGIGLKKAHKAVVMTHDPNIYNLLPRLPSYLNIRKLIVSKEYIENFKLADATLRHQVVFDPINRKLERLTDLETSGIGPEHLKNAGEMCDKDKAFQMALGNIDPFSLKIKDDWNPDATSTIKHSNSIWFREYKKPKSPQKTSKDLNVKPKSTKHQAVTVSTANILSIQQQEMINYDNNLTEELKMYLEPPPKRPKLINESLDKSQKSELNLEVDQPNVQICNPFIIKNKRLSKFGYTNIEKNECVRSPFFAAKSKDVESCASTIEDNKTFEVEPQIKECDTETANDESFTQITISDEDSRQSHGSANDSINLKTFAINKHKKLSKSRNAIDSCNLSDEEEHKSQSSSSDKLSDCVTSYSSLGSLNLTQTTEICSQITDKSTSDDEDGRTSPLLSSPAMRTFGRDKQSSNLEIFRFNKKQKKTFSKHSTDKQLRMKIISESNISSEKIPCENNTEEEGSKESDIENLTPNENFQERSVQSSSKISHHEESCRESPVFTTNYTNVCTNIQKEDDIEVSIIDEPKEIQSTLVKKPFKRSNSCRSVGLSRIKKKAAIQPTILSMFNKMTAKH